MSAETTPKLETFLIVAYKRIRKPAGKVFRSIKRKHLTGIGDGRLKSAFPLYYYRPRLHHSSDFTLKLKSPVNEMPHKLPLSQKIITSFDKQNNEFVHIFQVTRYNQVLHEETFRSNSLFECFLDLLEAEAETWGKSAGELYEHRKLIEDKLEHHPDAPKEFTDRSFTIYIRNGFLHYQDDIDSWVVEAKQFGFEDYPLLGSTSVADCIIGELGRYFLPMLDELGSTPEPEERPDDFYRQSELRIDRYRLMEELEWMNKFLVLLSWCVRFTSPKYVQAGEVSLDYQLVAQALGFANQLFTVCIGPFHDLIINQIATESSWEPQQVDFDDDSAEESDSELSSESEADSDQVSSSNDEEEEKSSSSSACEEGGEEQSANDSCGSDNSTRQSTQKYIREYTKLRTLFTDLIRPGLETPPTSLKEAVSLLAKLGSLKKFYQALYQIIQDVVEQDAFALNLAKLGWKAAVKLREAVSDPSKTSIKLWKTPQILTTGLLWMMLAPRVSNKVLVCSKSVPPGKSVNPQLPNRSHDRAIRYTKIVGQWVLEEFEEELRILDSHSIQPDPPRGHKPEPVFSANTDTGSYATPGFIALSETELIVPDLQQNLSFYLLDLAVTTADRLVKWSFKSPSTDLETYSCSKSVLAWITSGGNSNLGLYTYLGEDCTILLHTVRVNSPKTPVQISDLEQLTRLHEPKFMDEFASTNFKTLPLQLFSHQLKTAIAMALSDSEMVYKYILCFMVVTDLSTDIRPHTVSAHSTHHLQLGYRLPKVAWLAASHIHALYLAKDTSGHLFKHSGNRVVLFSRWTRLDEIAKVWPDAKTNNMQLRWCRTRRCLVAVNRNYINWEREGAPTYFELRV